MYCSKTKLVNFIEVKFRFSIFDFPTWTKQRDEQEDKGGHHGKQGKIDYTLINTKIDWKSC